MKKVFIFLILILVLGGSAYFVINETQWLRVVDIKFNANEALNIYDLQRYSGVKYGEWMFKINIEAVEKGLMEHPYVKAVEVTRTYPSTLNFNITYRKHYMNIKYSDIILSLDDSLMVLKVLDQENEGYTVEGMEFTSFATGKQIDVNELYILENIVKLIDLLNQSEYNANKTIQYEQSDIIVKIGDIKVHFGDGEHIEERFNQFVNIYESLTNEGVTSGVIDVSSDGLPVFRPFGK